MKKCFMVMPFSEDLDPIYALIKDICADLDVECRRSDEIAIGNITKGLFEEIFYADVVIADLTHSNPNVYYELAVAHCIGRKTILISQEDKIPFDIGHNFVIKYANTIEGATILKQEIKRLLSHVIAGGGIDNPAQMFLPKTREEEKIENLTDMSKEILISLVESRKMEIEIVMEKAMLISPDARAKVSADLDKLNALIDKIKISNN